MKDELVIKQEKKNGKLCVSISEIKDGFISINDDYIITMEDGKIVDASEIDPFYIDPFLGHLGWGREGIGVRKVGLTGNKKNGDSMLSHLGIKLEGSPQTKE